MIERFNYVMQFTSLTKIPWNSETFGEFPIEIVMGWIIVLLGLIAAWVDISSSSKPQWISKQAKLGVVVWPWVLVASLFLPPVAAVFAYVTVLALGVWGGAALLSLQRQYVAELALPYIEKGRLAIEAKVARTSDNRALSRSKDANQATDKGLSKAE